MAAESTVEAKPGPDTQVTPASWPVLSLAPRLLGFLLILVLAQHVYVKHLDEDEWPVGLCIGLGVAVAIGLFMLWRSRRTVLTTLSSIPFAVVLVLAIAGATALGTFVLQHETGEALEKLYGEEGAAWIGRFFLGDIFHSLWFGGLLALLVLALVLAVLKRPFWRPRYWGFMLTHGGMVAVIIGGAVGGQFGKRGILELHKGRSSDKLAPGEGDEDTLSTLKLPFSVKLLDFEAEKYPDQLRFEVWAMPKGRKEPEALQAVSLEQAREWTRIVGSGLSFRVREYNPDTPATAAPQPPRHIIEIEGVDEPLEVQVGQTYTVPGSQRTFRVVEFFPDFVYDIEHKRGGTRGEQPNNPALQVEEPGAGKDGGTLMQYLSAKMPGHGQKEGALPLTYKYEAAPQGPHVAVEFKKKGGAPAGEAVLFSSGDSNSFYHLSDSHVLLFRNKEGEVKSYRSTVEVIDEGKVATKAAIEVNSPLSYGGYSFYQFKLGREMCKNADSVLNVVKDPGLGLVYLGMVMISLGVAYVYYIRPRIGN